MVAYDDSDAARRALDRAADLAGYGSTLTVVSVATEGGRYQAGPLDRAREQLVRRQVTATYLQPVGEPAAELVEAARELGRGPRRPRQAKPLAAAARARLGQREGRAAGPVRRPRRPLTGPRAQPSMSPFSSA